MEFQINHRKGVDRVVFIDGVCCEVIETSTDSFGTPYAERLLLQGDEGSKSNPLVVYTWSSTDSSGNGWTDYLCPDDKTYNRESFEIPPQMNHPYHAKHPLQLLWSHGPLNKTCFCCTKPLHGYFYHCSSCDFRITSNCARKPAMLSIDHQKTHEHTLTFFPRQASLTCNACSLNDDMDVLYVCLQCDFMVHKDCIYLPRVIKISRHEHRLSHTYSFSSGDLSCGVCRKRVDNNYGGYSCNKGCSDYAVHSKCATREDVWDGKELEGVPEVADNAEGTKPFEKIGDGRIRHFSHEHHHLRLVVEEKRVQDESKRCEACILPIHHDCSFYTCEQCDFMLHEMCANLPRKKQHPLHPHPLTLEFNIDALSHDSNGYFSCYTCSRNCSGFAYKCPEKECYFRLHLPCALISEPFTWEGHPHPQSLFLTSYGKCLSCRVCREGKYSVLNCLQCGFVLCFSCATLPYKLRYKYDRHFLTLSYGEIVNASETYWCELCEKKINSEGMLYTCDECCVTVHTSCAFGEDPHLKPGRTIKCWNGKRTHILPNHRISRPVCRRCSRRCPYNIVFKASSGDVFCSFTCLYGFRSVKRFK